MSKFPTLPWTDAAARWLSGTPDSVLTVLLLVTGILCIVVAFRSTPLVKAVLIAWLALP